MDKVKTVKETPKFMVCIEEVVNSTFDDNSTATYVGNHIGPMQRRLINKQYRIIASCSCGHTHVDYQTRKPNMPLSEVKCPACGTEKFHKTGVHTQFAFTSKNESKDTVIFRAYGHRYDVTYSSIKARSIKYIPTNEEQLENIKKQIAFPSFNGEVEKNEFASDKSYKIFSHENVLLLDESKGSEYHVFKLAKPGVSFDKTIKSYNYKKVTPSQDVLAMLKNLAQIDSSYADAYFDVQLDETKAFEYTKAFPKSTPIRLIVTYNKKTQQLYTNFKIGKKSSFVNNSLLGSLDFLYDFVNEDEGLNKSYQDFLVECIKEKNPYLLKDMIQHISQGKRKYPILLESHELFSARYSTEIIQALHMTLTQPSAPAGLFNFDKAIRNFSPVKNARKQTKRKDFFANLIPGITPAYSKHFSYTSNTSSQLDLGILWLFKNPKNLRRFFDKMIDSPLINHKKELSSNVINSSLHTIISSQMQEQEESQVKYIPFRDIQKTLALLMGSQEKLEEGLIKSIDVLSKKHVSRIHGLTLFYLLSQSIIDIIRSVANLEKECGSLENVSEALKELNFNSVEQLHDNLHRINSIISSSQVIYDYPAEYSERLNKNIGDYQFRLASSNIDLKEAGSSMSICVGGYGNTVERGSCSIVTVHTQDKIEPQLCIQLNANDVVVQVRKRFNGVLSTDSDKDLIDAFVSYCKQSNLTIPNNFIQNQQLDFQFVGNLTQDEQDDIISDIAMNGARNNRIELSSHIADLDITEVIKETRIQNERVRNDYANNALVLQRGFQQRAQQQEFQYGRLEQPAQPLPF